METLSKLDGSGHSLVVADLCRSADIVHLADSATALNGVVHCAGITAVVPFRVISEKHLDEMLGINFRAPVLLTQRLIAKKQVLHGGSILFMTSSAAHLGTPITSMYSASKAALIAAARALASEVGTKQQIRVNCISPGYVRTPMIEELEEGPALQALFELAPLGIGEPEDVANAVVFFLSDASRWITRATLHLDGGLTSRISF